MKVGSIGNKQSREQGSSILEALIALAVLTLGISAVIMLVFANQTLKLDSETAGEALYKAKDELESNRASSTISTAEFNLVLPFVFPPDGTIYSKELAVLDLTPCKKEVTSRVTWSTEPSRPQIIELKTNLVDIPGAFALGRDCAADAPEGGWTLPATLGQIDLGPGEEATGIDVINKIVFLSAEASAAAKPDFFVVDATDGLNPVILSSIHTGPGLNAIDTARDLTTGNIYAYVVNNKISQQLQIIDVDAINNFVSPTLIGSADLEPAPLGTDSEGRSIFYYDKKVYVGTHYLPALPLNPIRPEFHIFDVSDPTLPAGSELGSYDVQHNINNIIVRGKYAYLATSDDSGEVWILDISTPASPTFKSKFDALGDEDGDSIYLLGNTLYLGRDHAPPSRPDFYVLDVTDPANIGILGSTNLSMSPSTAKVNGIRVSGRFAFLATGDSNQEFQVLDISNPASIPAPISTYNFPQEATGIDFENILVYASVRSNDALRIIRPAECADKIDDDLDGKIDIADPECHTDGDANNPASYNPEHDDESTI